MLMQGNQGQVGKQVGQGQTVGFGEFTDVLVTQLQSRYYEQCYRGNTFFVSVASAAGTAYTGAAGGTPLVAVHNPTGSGKNLVLKSAMVSVVASATAAGMTQFRIYSGPSVLPTGTLVQPFSALTILQGGSVAKGVSNAAMTSSTALTYVTTIGTYQFAVLTTSGGPTFMLVPPVYWDAAGQIIVPPGNQLALGAVTIPTAMTNDACLIWDEVPV
jgi:hypothetical protein